MPKPKMFQVSTATMLSHIEKLKLERGDVLLVKNIETLKFLSEMPIHLDFQVPLVFAPGGIQKLSRADLLNLLEQLDEARGPGELLPNETSAAPV